MIKLYGYSHVCSSKSGKEYTILEIGRSPYPYENCVGMKSDRLFLPGDVFNSISFDDLGKEIEPVYDLSGARPVLINVTVKNN